jgi:ATP-dependent RNA helicase DeaD
MSQNVLEDPALDSAALPETFLDLPLIDEVHQAILSSGYDKPTEVQLQIIPHMLAGRDVLAQSQTGTGKTAAFALPILSRIDTNSRQPQVLVLAPTRELAIQVAKSFTTYGNCLPNLNVLAIYGGQDYEVQFRQLRRGVQVVVGTPGRVIDHINRGTLDLSGIECLVLDEADEMLNMGFLEDVQFVLDKTPEQRQIALFSATLPDAIRSIAQRYLNDPVRITIKNKTMTADTIRQRALFVSPRDKVDVLTRILEVEETDGVIVFTKTREATVTVAEQLCREGLSAVALNGDMPQRTRERTIEQLKSGHLDILVATDVAARGLDVSRVSHVFNYDLPHDSESYVHRVGRTGRAGRKGEAIIFLTNMQRGKLRTIERVTKQRIEIVDPPTTDDINAVRIQRFHQRIADTITAQDLSLYTQLIGDFAKQSDQPIEVIAAALAEIAQQGRPFLLAKRGKKQRNRDDRSDDRRDDRRDSGRDRDDRGGRGRNESGNRERYEAAPHGQERGARTDRAPRTERGQRTERAPRTESGQRTEREPRSQAERSSNSHDRGDRKSNRRFGPPEAGMNRYRIEVGKQDGVGPGNIVGAIANEAGIDGQSIGPIRIHDTFSTIDLPDRLPRDVHQLLQNTWVGGKQLRLRLASEASDEPRPRRNKPAFKERNATGPAKGNRFISGKLANRGKKPAFKEGGTDKPAFAESGGKKFKKPKKSFSKPYAETHSSAKRKKRKPNVQS